MITCLQLSFIFVHVMVTCIVTNFKFQTIIHFYSSTFSAQGSQALALWQL